ncbi:MAG: restriction endonuclease subunit S, partial [Muribaculaceae bacterium]|nr:restriction endonuclease subunit S [Muribaculaceae bacterium]
MKHNWEYKRLGEVCEILNGYAFKSELFQESGKPILRITNIQNDIVTTDNLVYCNLNDYKADLTKFIVKPNNIVMALSGATTGKVGLNKTNFEFLLNQRVALFKNILISNQYLFYALKNEG